jgi:hypothetical protein
VDCIPDFAIGLRSEEAQGDLVEVVARQCSERNAGEIELFRKDCLECVATLRQRRQILRPLHTPECPQFSQDIADFLIRPCVAEIEQRGV